MGSSGFRGKRVELIRLGMTQSIFMTIYQPLQGTDDNKENKLNQWLRSEAMVRNLFWH